MLRLNCFHSSLHNHTTLKSEDHVAWCNVLQSDRQFEVFGGCRHLKYGFSLDILWVADALAYCITSLDLFVSMFEELGSSKLSAAYGRPTVWPAATRL